MYLHGWPGSGGRSVHVRKENGKWSWRGRGKKGREKEVYRRNNWDILNLVNCCSSQKPPEAGSE